MKRKSMQTAIAARKTRETLSFGLHDVDATLAAVAEEVGDAFALPPTVWLLDEVPCPGYGEYITQLAGGSLYASLEWRDILAQRHVGTPLYLVALCGNAIAGVLPLFGITCEDGRRELVSLPATPAAGPITDDESVRWLLESRALTLAGFRGCEAVRIRQYRPLNGTPPTNDEFTWVRVPLSAVATSEDKPAASGRVGPEWLERVRVHWDGPATPVSWCDALLAADNGDATRWLTHADTLYVMPTTAPLVQQDKSGLPLIELARLCSARGLNWLELRIPAGADVRARLGALATEAYVASETVLTHGEHSLGDWHPVADAC